MPSDRGGSSSCSSPCARAQDNDPLLPRSVSHQSQRHHQIATDGECLRCRSVEPLTFQFPRARASTARIDCLASHSERGNNAMFPYSLRLEAKDSVRAAKVRVQRNGTRRTRSVDRVDAFAHPPRSGDSAGILRILSAKVAYHYRGPTTCGHSTERGQRTLKRTQVPRGTRHHGRKLKDHHSLESR